MNSWLSDAMDRDGDATGHDGGRITGRSVTLFLVDVCGAGQAARLSWLSDMDDEQRQAWVLAGCQPDRPAFNGWFTQAMSTVLERAHAQEFDIHPSQRFIPLPLIAQNIRKETKRLCSDGYVQLVVGTPVDLAAEVDLPFFPNPGYSHDAAKQHHTLSMLNPGLANFCGSVDELVDPWHFYERALGRGPDRRTAVGCFRGRQRELATLTGWLDGESPGALRVVTGSPGSGKSALLGMLVCSAHPDLHEATQHVWFHRRDELPSVNPHLVALHLRDQNVDAILDSVARQTGLPTAAEDASGQALADALTRFPEPLVFVLDALDEAEDPGRVMSHVLEPLLDRTRPDGMPCCRLLVATRPWEQFDPLLARARRAQGLIDLDDVRRDELENALRSYVIDLLNGNNEYRQVSHRRLRDSIAGSVAGRLAARHAEERPQWGEFLVAGLYANSLAQQGGPTAAGADAGAAPADAAGVPGTLPEVLDLDLRRQTSPWVRPILCALAFARGQGMPRTAIRAIAPLFANPSLGAPAESDVRDALEEARFYLRRDMDVDGSIVYRLFHQALIDHLRSASTLPGRPAAAERLKERVVFDRLLDLVGRADDGGLYWEEASPYLLRHMSEHAAACGLLNTLAQDTEFLVHADPATLGAHLTGDASDSRSVVAVYRASLSCHQHLDAHARRSVLAIDAARHQMPHLAQRFSRPPRQQALAWQPRWVTGAPWELLPCESLMGLTEEVRSLSCGTVDGHPVVVAAGTREDVPVWDLETGREHTRLVGHRGPVNAVACCEVDGRAAVVTAGSDRSLRLWDLASGEQVATLTVDAGPVTSLVCVRLDGRPVVVASGRQGLVRAWDIAAATEKASLPGHQGPAWSATGITAPTGCGALVATGGYDGSVRVWDLAQGAEHTQLPRHESGVLAVAHLAPAPGESWLLTGGSDGVVRVFDLPAQTQRLSLDCRTDSVLALESVRLAGQDGRPELCLGVAGGSDGTLSVWDLAAGEKRFDLIGHVGAVNTVGITRLHGRPVLISGGDDGSCRVWDLVTGTQRGRLGSQGRYPALTSVDLGEGPVVVGAAGDGLHVWDVVRGVRVGSLALDGPVSALTSADLGDGPVVVGAAADGLRSWHLTGGGTTAVHVHTARVDAVTAAPGDARGAVVVAEENGALRKLELMNGSEAAALTGHRAAVRQVVFARLDGRPSVVSAGRDGTVRLWDGTSGRQLRALRVPADCVRALDTAVLSGALVAVIGASDGSMRVWDPGSGAHRLLRGHHRTSVRALATSTFDGGSMAVSVGGDGSVLMWDLIRGQCLSEGFSHSGPAWSVACGTVDGRPIAATAGGDGTIRTWDLLTRAETGTPITSAGTVWDLALAELDGRPVLMTAGFDKTVGVIDIRQRRLLGALAGHQDSVDSIDVTTAEDRLIAVSGGSDGTARVWDVGDKRCLGLIHLPGPGTSVAAGPDGSVVVAFDNEVAVLDCGYDIGELGA
ncbi:NACHT domain-containing protein [Streptomyces sp. AF1A]|uniref:NACHT domain-containing protein n=1 Tax=Streptomyces sp. AF1A TaxID=3394350 RepID=UPI0039BCEF82